MEYPQPLMIEKVKNVALADERISAVLMYGSFIKGEGDQYSDIEFYIFCRREIDHQQWVTDIRPIRMFFQNEFGTEVAIFDNLVRGEFHFAPIEEIEVIKSWQGLTSFEYAARMILVDKDKRLDEVLDPIPKDRPRHDSADHILWLGQSLLNNLLMIKNLILRGEYAHAQQCFQYPQKYLAWLIRLADNADNHWESPTKKLEQEISPAWYEAYAAAAPDLTLTAELMPARLDSAVQLSRKLFAQLNLPDDLTSLLEDIDKYPQAEQSAT